MLTFKLSRAFFVLCLFTALPTNVHAEDGFERIFDGETLSGWKALDMSYWSVRDGAIYGVQSTELIDQEEGHFDLRGILGLHLCAGEPMFVQFKDIDLKLF
mgnify:CR=1 FL=1